MRQRRQRLRRLRARIAPRPRVVDEQKLAESARRRPMMRLLLEPPRRGGGDLRA